MLARTAASFLAVAALLAGCAAAPTPRDVENPDAANLIPYAVSVRNNATREAAAILIVKDPLEKRELINTTFTIAPGLNSEREFAGNYTREYSIVVLDAQTDRGIAYTTSANVCFTAVKYRFELAGGEVNTRGSFCQDLWNAAKDES